MASGMGSNWRRTRPVANQTGVLAEMNGPLGGRSPVLLIIPGYG
jgi:hypothetical protein